MTIEDAIRRAKLMGQARLKRNDVEDDVLARSDRSAGGTDAGRASVRAAAPAVPLESLPTIEISEAACEQSRVLLTESQQRDYPAADAAYRLLRSRLQNRLKQNNWFSLAIASPSQNDGKSITSLNLAVSIAREKQKPVYLLDLDMRNPSICAFLGLHGLKPLPDYFQGNARIEDVLYQTSFPNLIVAGATVAVDGASEMLAGPRFSELLAHIRMRSPNACVLLDLPPVNVTDEALLVGPRVDAFLVVVSEGRTERKQLAQTLSSLAEFTVAGVVVNRSSDSHTFEYSQYTA
jgi:capsular exopolysaccharide synthesis family protein